MDQNITERLAELEQKVDKIYVSVRRIQMYFLITGIITIVAVVVPLIGLAIAIPHYIDTLNSIQGL